MTARAINRRDLIRIGGLVGGAVFSGVGRPALTSPLARVPRRTLGKTKKSVPILMMGGSMAIDIRFDTKFAEAFRRGVDYFDTSRVYVGGNGEVALANFHRKMKCRDRMWITTKSKRHDPDGMAASLAESLDKLQTDHVDLFFLHALTDGQRLDGAMARRVDGLKKSGKIKHFGFSTHATNVVELLELAARTPWVETVMFRYNFRKYGDRALNRAIDKAANAGVGLIAMKTQGAELALQDKWQQIQRSGRWNKYQAVLKAVWADDRITGLVSEMDTLDKVRQNVAAAVDETKLGALDQRAIRQYAEATRHLACDGCDHLCGSAIDAELPIPIGDALRTLSYHEVYEKPDAARTLWAELPGADRLATVDFEPARRACPHGVDVVAHMRRAAALLSPYPRG